MLAAWIEDGSVSVRRQRKPRADERRALIRLLCGGICNTDLELQRGYYGYRGVPGHEFVGEVIDAHSKRLIGKRVVGEINVSCGLCEWCAAREGRHCAKREVLGILKYPGAFREFLTLPEENLHIVPDSIPTEQAVFTEPLAAACRILDQVRIHPGELVAVLGDGKLGLLIAQVLAAHGARVHLYGRHKAKLKIAELAGAEGRSTGKLPSAFYAKTVEATGSAEGLRQAVGMTRPRGTVIMKSTVHETVKLDTAPVVVNEISLLGSRCGRFEPALRLLGSGKIHVEEMIADRFPLSEAPRAFARAAEKGTLKVLLTT
jgi:threonine dehydrogenase-like Zn-dependent dehydrogenase